MLPKSNHEELQSKNHSHQVELSERTQLEHDDLIVCMHRLEAALASPAPGREPEWATRASRELREVQASLKRHIASAEGEHGLFAELDLTQGSAPARVTNLRQDHVCLLEKAEQLSQNLLQQGKLPDFAALRLEAEELLAALRQHYSSEVDLIYECFWLDIGVGD